MSLSSWNTFSSRYSSKSYVRRSNRDTVCAVAMKGTESAYDSVADPLFRAQARIDRAQQEQKRALTQEPGNQCASQVAVTWRSYDERKVDLGEIVRGA